MPPLFFLRKRVMAIVFHFSIIIVYAWTFKDKSKCLDSCGVGTCVALSLMVGTAIGVKWRFLHHAVSCMVAVGASLLRMHQGRWCRLEDLGCVAPLRPAVQQQRSLQALVRVTRLTFLLGLGLHQHTNQLPVGGASSQPHIWPAFRLLRTETAAGGWHGLLGQREGRRRTAHVDDARNVIWHTNVLVLLTTLQLWYLLHHGF